MMDKAGNKAARLEIAMIKVAAPNVALRVIDDAIQAHGGGGVTSDFGLARLYANQRTLRLADGPDEVHNRTIARMEFAKYGDAQAPDSGGTGRRARAGGYAVRRRAPAAPVERSVSALSPRLPVLRERRYVP